LKPVRINRSGDRATNGGSDLPCVTLMSASMIGESSGAIGRRVALVGDLSVEIV
jgi:hypothetical protein